MTRLKNVSINNQNTVPSPINGAPSIQVKKIWQDAASSNGDARIKKNVRKKGNETHAFKALILKIF